MMNLAQLADLGEFIGGIAVLVTLIYLAVQIREGRKDLRLESELNLADRSVHFAFQYGVTPDLARILETSLRAPESLDEDERRRAMWIIVSYFNGMDALYSRFLDGVVTREAWTPHERIMSGLLRGSLTQRWWATRMNLAFSDQFRAFVDRKLANPCGDYWEAPTPTQLATQREQESRK